MENDSAMKKLLLICIIGLLTAAPVFAEEKKVVSLRFSQQDNAMRIVLESEDNLIKNANIIAGLSSIKIEFPDLFELRQQKNFVFDTSVKNRLLSITLKNIEDVVSYKLASPSRIVMDLKVSQKKLPDTRQVQTGEKPKQEPLDAAEKAISSRVIFLDSGHGGYDYGLLSKDIKEKDLNLLLTKDLIAALSKKGNKVFLTRKADHSLSMLDRIILANSKKPDIFISIHSSASNAFAVYTATSDEAAAETHIKLYSLTARQSRHLEKSRGLAKALGNSLKNEFKGEVFIRELPLPLLNSMDSTAVIIEYPSLKLNTYDQKMRERLVNAIAKGVQSYE